MGDMVLTKARIRAGVWEGVLTGAPEGPAPRLEVLHQDAPVEGVRLSADPSAPGRFRVAVPIPAELLSDGVQTFVFRDAARGARLGSFTIVTGEPLEEDIRAEVDLLRAELDLLKKAFRRHCLETM
ncbi:hypothetical protein [Actibacterium sp. MT2.3-13A]|uniref:hypothetical protein n=1 Tax=Actibacterium sp. MT2.3-13A TaxID=2828332 RepID=UPI001BAA7C73|nr:hypothetical protein [Actibacterium sp. MT2.3-13A]